MIQTGEASGTLDDILQKMSVYYAKEVEMEGKVRTAMIYPFILLLASIGASVFLLTTVLPQFADILEEYELPAITRFMMAAGEHLQRTGSCTVFGYQLFFWYLPCYRLFPSCG